jgi:transcriptional regulator of acetoin/glycerol metabolism
VLLCDGPLIRHDDAAPVAAPARADTPLPNYREARARALDDFERDFLLRALKATRGNVSSAAQLVGKERRAFGKLLKKHAIDRAALDS